MFVFFLCKMPPGFPVETKKQKVIFVIGMLAAKTALAHYTLLSMHIIFIIDMGCTVLLCLHFPLKNRSGTNILMQSTHITARSDIITQSTKFLLRHKHTSNIMNCEIGGRWKLWKCHKVLNWNCWQSSFENDSCSG